MSDVRFLQGHVLDRLRELPDESVHVCVTSPPYWGLRDYGIPGCVWGGDAGCPHQWRTEAHRHQRHGDNGTGGNLEGGTGAQQATRYTPAPTAFCALCGAWRGSLGLEPTVDLYVAHIVQVFREVRRVLRRDGVLFLNIGDSYAGAGYSNHKNTGGAQRSDGGKQKHTSSGRSAFGGQRVGLYDTDGTPKAGYRGNGHSSQSPDDGHIDSAYPHTPDTSPDLDPKQVRESCLKIQAYMDELRAHLPNGDYSGHSERVQSLAAMRDRLLDANRVIVPARVVLESILDESSQQLQADYHQSGMISACLSSLHSFSAYAQVCAHRLGATSETPDYTEGTASLYAGLAHHIQCTSECCSLVLSWFNLPHIQPQYTTSVLPAQLPPKSLMMIPARVALAMQADGWVLRSEITWCKRAPMPESVTDRPTSATEKIYLFARSERYYFDQEAVREPASETTHNWLTTEAGQKDNGRIDNLVKPQTFRDYKPTSRNLWNYWLLSPESFAEAHFATYPTEIPRRAIKAGTSEWGVCAECGSPWRRVVEREVPSTWQERKANGASNKWAGNLDRGDAGVATMPSLVPPNNRTTGWQPTCPHHDAPIVPAVVLDPFSGAGTSALVALELGRDFVGIELNEAYIEMSKRRLYKEMPLWAYTALGEGEGQPA